MKLLELTDQAIEVLYYLYGPSSSAKSTNKTIIYMCMYSYLMISLTATYRKGKHCIALVPLNHHSLEVKLWVYFTICGARISHDKGLLSVTSEYNV